MKKLAIFFAFIFLVITVSACSKKTNEIYFEQDDYTLSIGQTITLTPQFNFSAGQSTLANNQITFSSEDTTIATVSPSGIVTATGVGTTVIWAKMDTLSAWAEIIVQ